MVRAIAFVVGAASLGTEIAAARLLAPYFGASTIIWANTIATVLVALSAGYWLGGKLADRRADLRGLCAMVLVASLLLALVPFVADPFLRLSVNALGSLSVGGFAGSLVAVLVLVAVPIMLLGTVAPYVSRLSVRSVERDRAHDRQPVRHLHRRVAGGDVPGGAAAHPHDRHPPHLHRLRPVAGARVGAGAAACGGSGWSRWSSAARWPSRRRRSGPGWHGRPGHLRDRDPVPVRPRRPVPRAASAGCSSTRAWPSTRSTGPGSYLTRGYWDDFLVLPFAAQATAPGPPPSRIAILGDAAGTVARAYGHYFPATRVDAVELDGELTQIGKRYFDLHGPRLHLYTADARPWLEASHARYDAIFLDAYRQPYIPFYLVTREFFASARAHLQPGGTLVVNVGHLPDSDALEKVVTATLQRRLPVRGARPVSADNSLLVASTAPLSGGCDARRARASCRSRSRGCWPPPSGRLGPRCAGGPSTPTTRRRSSGSPTCRSCATPPARADRRRRRRRRRGGAAAARGPGAPARRPWGPA